MRNLIIKYNPLDVNIYILNLALMINHEIDSAYWNEWNLFGVPGGIEGFIVFNFLFVVFALFGLKLLINGKRSGLFFAVFLSAAGIFAFIVHMHFILTGHPEFTSAVSIIILSLIFIVSLIQGIFTILTIRKKI